MGLAALRKIQIGEEGATKGDAVAATAALLGKLTMKDVPTIHMPSEERGSLAEFHRSVKTQTLAELTLEHEAATYEQILYLLHMGILGNVTPSVVDTDARLWTFTPALTAAGVFDSFTIEFGDDVQAWEADYCMASLIEFSGAMGEPIKARGDIFAQQIATTTFTAGKSPPTVETILMYKTKLYIDDEDGTIGTTEKASTLIGFTYTITTGLGPKFYADGGSVFSAYGENFKNVELRMTFAFNSGVNTERAKFDGGTQRLIRIEAEGSVCGAATAKRTLTLDLCGIWTAWESLGERDGEDIVEVTMLGQYGVATYHKLFEVAVQNAVTSLP